MHQPAPRGLRRALRAIRRRRTALVAVLVLLAGPAAIASPAAAAGPEVAARAWILVDPDDAAVLDAHAAHRAYPVASTTKLMTAYVAREELRPKEIVVAPGYAPSSGAESLLGLVKDERIATRDLLYGLILASGNDAAEALAVAVSGSVERFVERMNREAAALGLEDTHYANPIGLDDPANYSTAADLVALAAELREDRLMRRIFDAPAATLRTGARTREIENRNDLVRTVPFVDGIKTGYTLGAGNVLVASGRRGGVELISAVLGAPSEEARDAESLELLRYGFGLYRSERVVARSEPLATTEIAEQNGRLELLAQRPVVLTVRRGQEVATTAEAPAEVEGPIAAGAELGELVVTVDGVPRERIALVAAADVPEASVGDRLDSALPGPRFVAWLLVALAAAAALAALLAITRRVRAGEARP